MRRRINKKLHGILPAGAERDVESGPGQRGGRRTSVSQKRRGLPLSADVTGSSDECHQAEL